MNLSIPERLVLMGLITPEKEDWASWREINKALMELSFTSDEHTEYGIEQVEGRVTWNDAGGAYLRDIPISEWMTTKIQEKLREMNSKHGLERKHISLYDKFIVAYDQV